MGEAGGVRAREGGSWQDKMASAYQSSGCGLIPRFVHTWPPLPTLPSACVQVCPYMAIAAWCQHCRQHASKFVHTWPSLPTLPSACVQVCTYMAIAANIAVSMRPSLYIHGHRCQHCRQHASKFVHTWPPLPTLPSACVQVCTYMATAANIAVSMRPSLSIHGHRCQHCRQHASKFVHTWPPLPTLPSACVQVCPYMATAANIAVSMRPSLSIHGHRCQHCLQHASKRRTVRKQGG